MAELFQIVAGQHRVSSADVRQALLDRRIGVDLAIMLPFALLYIVAAVFIARFAGRSRCSFLSPSRRVQ